MGYYEGWDNVWGDNRQILGWICPRCEQFVPMYQEHICSAAESDQSMQMSEARQEAKA